MSSFSHYLVCGFGSDILLSVGSSADGFSDTDTLGCFGIIFRFLFRFLICFSCTTIAGLRVGGLSDDLDSEVKVIVVAIVAFSIV